MTLPLLVIDRAEDWRSVFRFKVVYGSPFELPLQSDLLSPRYHIYPPIYCSMVLFALKVQHAAFIPAA
jgi:hypothetical protein